MRLKQFPEIGLQHQERKTELQRQAPHQDARLNRRRLVETSHATPRITASPSRPVNRSILANNFKDQVALVGLCEEIRNASSTMSAASSRRSSLV